MTDDVIYRQAAIDAIDVLCQEHRYKIPGKRETYSQYNEAWQDALDRAGGAIFNLPSSQPERLTDDDFETIRIHLNAYKEKLCNQRRWEEAAEYQRIIDRFMAFASAQPPHSGRRVYQAGYADGFEAARTERKTGRWLPDNRSGGGFWVCSCCKFPSEAFAADKLYKYCPVCGADMREENT